MRKYYLPNEGWTEPAEADGTAPQSAKFPALQLSLAAGGDCINLQEYGIFELPSSDSERSRESNAKTVPSLLSPVLRPRRRRRVAAQTLGIQSPR